MRRNVPNRSFALPVWMGHGLFIPGFFPRSFEGVCVPLIPRGTGGGQRSGVFFRGGFIPGQFPNGVFVEKVFRAFCQQKNMFMGFW